MNKGGCGRRCCGYWIEAILSNPPPRLYESTMVPNLKGFSMLRFFSLRLFCNNSIAKIQNIFNPEEFFFSKAFLLIAIVLPSYRVQCTTLSLTGCIPGENKGVKPHEIRAGSRGGLMC